MAPLNKLITDKTALYYLAKIDKQATVAELTVKFNIPRNLNLSGALATVAKLGFCTTSKDSENKRIFKINKAGKIRVSKEGFLESIQSPEDLEQMRLNMKKLKEEKILESSKTKAVISKTITPTANLAINALSDVIQENQKLEAMLKGIYLQLHARYGMNDEPNQG